MTMGTYQRAARWPALLLMSAVVLAGCSYSGPQAETSDEASGTASNSFSSSSSGNGSNGNGSATGDNGSEAEVYSWGLPPSDTSVAGNDGPAYAALQRSCAEGQAYLDAVAPDGYGFRSPLNVVLFAAGIKLCNGDVEGAAELYTYGTQRYGLSGLPEGKPECELYKSVRSVLEQQERTAFPCPEGLPPENIIGPTGLVDDPLTMDVDESQPTESPTPTEGPTISTGETTTTETSTPTGETDMTPPESTPPSSESPESVSPTP